MLLDASAWLVVLFAALGQASSSPAQTDAALNREARIIFETVMSPYCPGRTISNCPAPQSDELRVIIKQQLASGETPDEVKEKLYATFGDDLRTVPRATGFGLLAWIVPGLGFLAGTWAIVVWMRRTRIHEHAASVPSDLDIDPDIQARLDAEMEELDSIT